MLLKTVPAPTDDCVDKALLIELETWPIKEAPVKALLF